MRHCTCTLLAIFLFLIFEVVGRAVYNKLSLPCQICHCTSEGSRLFALVLKDAVAFVQMSLNSLRRTPTVILKIPIIQIFQYSSRHVI